MPFARSKIRVAHVITGLGVGGAEMMLVKLLAETDRDRFPSTVISLSSDLALAGRVTASGIDVSAIDSKASVMGGLSLLPRLRARLAAFRPDLVQTWMYHADLAGGLAARSLGIPAVWNVQTSTVDPDHIGLRTRGLVRTCGLLARFVPRRVVSCSFAAVGLHAAIGYPSSKFVVIPNGTDLDAFRPDAEARAAFRAEIGVGPDVPVAGMIARLHPQKDHATLFAAVAELVQTHAEVKIVLCGLGLERSNEQLVERLRHLGIERNIVLLGLRSDVAQVLSGLDLHVLSSSFGEGFPNVLGEAMATGLPCVVTDVGDSPLIVADTGLTVQPRQPAALAAALRQMFDMPRRRLAELGQRARARIAEHFSLDKSIAAYESLYEDLAAGAGVPGRAPRSEPSP